MKIEIFGGKDGIGGNKILIEHFEIKEFFAHASGHASGNEIRDMIKQMKPKNLIPIHTEHPEMF